MNTINYRVSLDMFEALSQTTIKAKRGDSACKIHISLTKHGKIFNIGEGCHATFNAKKSDGNFIYDNCTIEGDTIVYDFASSIDENGTCQVSAIEGNIDCEVTLYNANNEQLTSPRFTLFIDSVIYNGEEIASSPEADVLRGLIVEARTTIDEMEDLIEEGVGEGGGGGTVTDEQIATAVESYLEKNPVSGIPGADGADGKDGIDGKDGADGVSATHSWDGTVLTITSASGSSSADLKGEKGEAGQAGIDGNDGFSIFQFFGDNYGSAGTQYACEPLGVQTNGRDVQVGDYILFGSHLTRVTSVTTDDIRSVFVLDLKGKNGVSPSVSVTDITGGHRITITDVDGEETVDVMDGASLEEVEELVGWKTVEASLSTAADYLMIEIPNPDQVSEVIVEVYGGITSINESFSGFVVGMNNIAAEPYGLTTAQIKTVGTKCYFKQRFIKGSVWSAEDATVIGSIANSFTDGCVYNINDLYSTFFAIERTKLYSVWVKNVNFNAYGEQLDKGTKLTVKYR